MMKKRKIWSQYSYIIVFLLIFLLYAVSSNGLTWNGMMNIFRHSAVIGIIALGMGLICLTGEIDLSVGSMLALVGGLTVVVFNKTGSLFATLAAAVVLGMLCGMVNGILVGAMEMPSFIVTLATMLIFRSVAQYTCQHISKEAVGGGSSVYRMNSEFPKYQILYQFGNGKIMTLPMVGLVMLAVTVIIVYLSTSTKLGKKIYAIGSNIKAAKMSGIHVNLIKVLVFVLAGILTGAAAFIWIAMNGSSDPATSGKSYEMYAIAAVVLGGISMSGGKGKCLGILFGAMSYTIIDKIIVALKMDSLLNDAIKGMILLLVILIQMAEPKIKDMMKRSGHKKEL